MSMLSSLCERLRDRAHELESLAPGLSAPYVVPSTKETMSLAMTSAASEMRDAADTIWELRNRLAGTIDMRERARLAEVENERLRELVRDMHEEMRMVSEIWAEDVCAQRMQELGIEVD